MGMRVKRFAALLVVSWVTIRVLHNVANTVEVTTDPLPRFQDFPSGAIDNAASFQTLLNVRTETAQAPKPVRFLETMRQFPWDPFNQAVLGRNTTEIRNYATNLTRELYPFLLRAPPTPVDTSCQAPSINYSAVIHNCTKLAHPRKVGVLLTFSFEVDALEIHFHELDAVVDKFFLIESESTHQPHFVKSKPLIWETLTKDPRFAPFVHKTVHFILTQQEVTSADLTDKFAMENLQRRVLWDEFQRWNNRTEYFSDEDVLGFGDVDEIPERNNVAFLKNCKFPTRGYSLDIGIWFPMDGIDTVFRTDHPVPGHPFTLGFPTFFTLGRAKLAQTARWFPRKLFGRSGSYLLGGIHLTPTSYLYSPLHIMKYLTAGESGWAHLERIVELGLLYRNSSVQAAMWRVLNRVEKWLPRILNLTEFQRKFPDEAEKIVKVPWFLKCNLKRYPGVNSGTWDPRLD